MNRAIAVGTAVAVVVVVAAWWLVLWSPRSKSYDQANKAAQAAQGQVTQLQTELGRLQASERQLSQLQAEQARLKSAIPDTAQLDQIILDVNGAAAQSGVLFQTISPTPPTAATASAPRAIGVAPAPPAVHLAISVSGGYQQLLDFVNRLDDLPRLFVIDNISVSASSGGSGAELSVSISARVFLTQAPAAPGTGTTTTTTTATTGSSTTTAPTIPPGGGAIG